MNALYLDTKAGRLAVEVVGEGSPIFFWPSLFLDRSIFAPQIAHFAKSYRVIAVDGPGHGESGKPLPDMTIEDCADAVSEILVAQDIGPVSFVGASWGGLVGVALATRYPSVIDRLAILGSPLADPLMGERLQSYIMLSLYGLFGGTERMIRGLMSQGIGNQYRQTEPDAFDALVRRATRASYRDRLPAMRAVMLKRLNMLGCLSQLRIPVMLIRGAEDAFLSSDQFACQATALPTATVRVIADSGHLPSMENPEETTAALVDFLSHPQEVRSR
jgi:3-oxoadipate enol-lactonase